MTGGQRDLERRFVALTSPTAPVDGTGAHPCQGLYVTPRGRRPAVAVVAAHFSADFCEHYLGPPLARHGLGFLGWNTRYRGDDAHLMLDHAVIDVGVAVRWLRHQAGAQTVVLLGSSGGGSLMAAYQSQATAPAGEPALRPVAGMRPARGLAELVPGDAFVAVAAHGGRPDVLTNWLDPAVVDETDPVARDPALDLWAGERAPPFGPDFVARYRAAQAARNHRITDWAEAELVRVRSGGVTDRLFPVFGTWADPRMVDPSLDPSNRPAGRCYAGDPRAANRSPWGLCAVSSLRTWLSMWSLRTSSARADPHLRRIAVPSLVIDADADTGVFPSDVDRLATALGAPDVTRLTLPGDHYFVEPTGARQRVADAIAGWVQARFAR